MQPEIKDLYEIEIPNEKAATYKVVTFIIALVNAAGFSVFYFNEIEPGKQILVVLGAVTSLIAFVFYILQLTQKKSPSFRVELSFIMAAIIWFLYGNLWLGSLLLLFAIFGFYSSKKTIIQFNKSGIIYPSIPKKTFEWPQVDFVILKDGILTIEMKDNRVFQFTLLPGEAAKLDEPAFNSFCNSHTL